MDAERNKIVDKSRDREYFGQWPQIVWALCRTPYDFTLWNVIKMVAGESGECYLSTPDLAALAMMSEGKVSDSRDYLKRVGLIQGECRREPGYPQPVWHITIPDIWEENIVWRKGVDSLKERIELKQYLAKSMKEAGILRRLPTNTKLSGTLKDILHVESLHNVKPSQCEEGVSQNEEGVSQNETKKNQSDIQTDNYPPAPSAEPVPAESTPPQQPTLTEVFGPSSHSGNQNGRHQLTADEELAMLVGNRPNRGDPAFDAEYHLAASGWDIRGPDAQSIRKTLINLLSNTKMQIPRSDKRRGYWYKELKVHVQEFPLEVQPELYREAERRMEEGNLTRSSPQSYTEVMAAIYAERKNGSSGYVPPGWTPEAYAAYLKRKDEDKENEHG